jgi:acetolactate synthase I/II/III large subunit
VIFNNSSYGNVRRDQLEQYQGRLLGADLENPDFVKLAESFGVRAMRVRTPADLESSLRAALDAGRPVVIEVPIERGSEISPWPFTLPAPHPG